jgi:Mor family transcriptional regulator
MEDKRERNKQLYQDKINGMSYTEVCRKYNISLTRVQQIFRRERAKDESKE